MEYQQQQHSPPQEDLQQGVLHGERSKFLIFHHLGQGLTSHVFQGEVVASPKLPPESKVALKVFKSQFLKSSLAARYAVAEEMITLMELQESNHFVKIYECEQGATIELAGGDRVMKGVWYMALELVQQQKLAAFIMEFGYIPEEQTRFFAKQLIDGLLFMLSKKLSHRDLKPDNLLLGKDLLLKIADFGFACPPHGCLDQVVGTVGYMAPELHEGRVEDWEKADVFSLGVVLFNFVTGRVPFADSNVTSLKYQLLQGNPDEYFEMVERKVQEENKNEEYEISEELKDLLQNMLVHDPKKRYKLSQVLQSDWLSEAIPTKEEVQKYINDHRKKNYERSQKSVPSKSRTLQVQGDFSKGSIPVEEVEALEKEYFHDLTYFHIQNEWTPDQFISSLQGHYSSKFQGSSWRMTSAVLEVCKKELQICMKFILKQHGVDRNGNEGPQLYVRFEKVQGRDIAFYKVLQKMNKQFLAPNGCTLA